MSLEFSKNKCKEHSVVAKGEVLRMVADLNYLARQLLDEVILHLARFRGVNHLPVTQVSKGLGKTLEPGSHLQQRVSGEG